MKVAVFGGSFSCVPESRSAKEIWKEKLGCEITDYGVGGMGFSLSTGEDNIQVQTDRAVRNEKYDVYVLWASNNDVFQNQRIGSYYDYSPIDGFDETKRVTQCGGINYCIKTIFEHNPKGKIIFFTTLSSEYEQGFSNNPFYIGGAYDYVKGQIACCRYWGVPCLDMFVNVPINYYTKPVYVLEDGVHLTEDAYRYMGNMQAEFIKNH